MREKVVQFFKVQLLFSDYSSFFLLWSVAQNFYARLAWLFQCTTTIFMLKVHVLILFRMGFFWAAYGWGGTFWPPSLKSVTHILQWWNLAQLYLTSGKSQKYIYHVTHPFSSADINIFSPEISKICYIKKWRYRLDFDT